MKIAVTGYGGYLKKSLLKRGLLSIDCDITKKDDVIKEINRIAPDVIIHCAAKTSVEWCEDNRIEAYRVNVWGTGNVVEAFQSNLLIYISTSHVFDGLAWHAYHENHVPNPVNVYGMTKYAAELVSLLRPGKTIIVRASKLFSADTVAENIRKLLGGQKIEVSDVIRRSYTHVETFVDALLRLIDISDRIKEDIIHLSSNDDYSEYQFWLSICSKFGIDFTNVIGRKSELRGLVPRPLRAAFHCGLASTYGIVLPRASDGIAMLKEEVVL